ncbi:DUF599 domain-containing protein [Hoeflea sp. TYP-13]|uniref:DUF599 domain-containing protein n=1 Tax=Hoeflea sp. TYP-13 TaxID=3230023 RepID=UPI0034C62F25
MSHLDFIAVFVCFVGWVLFAWSIDRKHGFMPVSLSQAMNIHRARWLENCLCRDLKMIDTSILAGLQQGTGFFASTALFAIGGCFALLGATDQVLGVLSGIPLSVPAERDAFELKVAGLLIIFAYSFFKFGWSYRLFNYCQILIGCIPMVDEVEKNREHAQLAVRRAVEINILAGKHFNAGFRAIFISLGYIGWFIGPVVFLISTALVMIVLVRRQYFSAARRALMSGVDI